MARIRIEPDMLAIILTDQCNAQCSMCCFGCSPYNKNVAGEDTVVTLIKQAAQMPNIKKVGFSGGEAFLQFELLKKMTKLASDLGLKTSCTTNGFWATSYEKAEEKLLELKQSGIGKIGLSMDHFHQKYVDIECIKRILVVCRKLSIPVDVGSVITKATSDLSEYLKVLKDDLVNIPHYRAACLPIGKAQDIAKQDLYYEEGLLNNPIKCYELTYFSVYLNGDVYPCCSQAGLQEALKLGNIKKDSLKDILDKYRMNMHIRILKKYGFAWYLDKAEKEGFMEVFRRKYVNKCDLCHLLFNDKLYLESISKYIEHEKELIYKKYLAEQESK